MVTVSKEISRLEHSAVKLTLTVAKDDVRSAYDKLVDKYAKSLQIPGFRKGKAPKNILERKLGDALKGEAIAFILEEAAASVFENKEELPSDARPLPYSTPNIDAMPDLDLEADLVFTLTYDTMPAVALGQWRGIEIEVPEVVIGEEEIQRELALIQERNAVVQDRDDGASAVAGDVVTVNYAELTSEGSADPATERQDFVFTLGSGYNLFKFDDDILGMKKGDTKAFEKSFPEDFPNTELAGKTKNIRVTLTAIKEKTLPVLDDEFAQDVDETYKTLEDLKNNIRNRLSKELDERLYAFKINKIMEKIMENAPVDLPESMIQIQLERHWQNLAQRLNTTVDDLKETVKDGRTPLAAMIAAWRPETVKVLHSGLILEAISKELNIAVSDEDIKAHIEDLSRKSGMPLEDMQKYYEQGETREYLEEEVKEERAYKEILEASVIKSGNTMNYREFAENNG